MASARTIGIGVVGCGFFGRQLARELARQPGARLEAVSDVSADAANALAEELSCVVEPDAASLACREDVDVVVVATPNHLHVEPVLAAAAAGKSAFVEKPMALRAADCHRMLMAARNAGTRLVVGHVLRLLPAVAEMRRVIESGDIGQPILARALRTRWGNMAGLPADWWKLKRTLSGGELLHEIHELDLLCWLLGDVESVFARAANLAHSELVDYEDAIHVSLQFSSGALGILEIGTAYRSSEWQVRIGGTTGAMLLDLRDATLTMHLSDDAVRTRGVFDEEAANESLRTRARTTGQAYNTASTVPPRWMEHAVELEMRSVVEQARTGAPSPLAEACERAVVVAEAVMDSASRGEAVRPGGIASVGSAT